MKLYIEFIETLQNSGFWLVKVYMPLLCGLPFLPLPAARMLPQRRRSRTFKDSPANVCRSRTQLCLRGCEPFRMIADALDDSFGACACRGCHFYGSCLFGCRGHCDRYASRGLEIGQDARRCFNTVRTSRGSTRLSTVNPTSRFRDPAAHAPGSESKVQRPVVPSSSISHPIYPLHGAQIFI